MDDVTTATTRHMSMSLDGFAAGPSQSREHPLGIGGRELHTWHLGDVTDEADLTAQSWLPERLALTLPSVRCTVQRVRCRR